MFFDAKLLLKSLGDKEHSPRNDLSRISRLSISMVKPNLTIIQNMEHYYPVVC